MKNNIYAAFNEIYYILENSDKDIQDKIPKKIKDFIKENKDENYKINIDFSKKLNNQNLLPQTKEMMAILYRDYLCSKEERKLIINKAMKIQKELEAKYDISNIFEKRKKNHNAKEINQLPIEIKKKKWYEKIIEIFYKIFKRN